MSVLDSVEIPEGWEVHPFGRVTRRSKISDREDLPPLSVFLNAGVVPRSSREDNHNQLGEDMSKYLLVNSGDIVFNKLRTWQGGFGASRYEGVVSPAYFVCRPGKGVDSRFVDYLLHSSPYITELTRVSKFMPPSQFDILWDDLKQLSLMLPPIGVQRAIADFLDAETARIDALIAKKQRMVELLDQSWRSLASDLIGTWAQDPSASLRLSQVLERIIDYRGATPVKSDDGVPLITAGCISDGQVQHARSPQYIPHEDFATWMRRGFPKVDDLILTTEGPLGEVALIENTHIALAQRIVLLRVRRDLVLPQYLYLYLRSPLGNASIMARGTGSTVIGVRTDRLREVPVICPTLDQQASIVRSVATKTRSSSLMIGLLKRQIGLLYEHRQALITAVVTGQLEIPEVIRGNH